MEPKFNFSLTQKEADLMLHGLSQLPFKDVHALISNMMEQFRAANQPQVERNENNDIKLYPVEDVVAL